jgi:hypothetical protein
MTDKPRELFDSVGELALASKLKQHPYLTDAETIQAAALLREMAEMIAKGTNDEG